MTIKNFISTTILWCSATFVNAAIYCPNNIHCAYDGTNLHCTTQASDIWDKDHLLYNIIPDKGEAGDLNLRLVLRNPTQPSGICMYANDTMIENYLGYVAVNSYNNVNLSINSYLPNKWIKGKISGQYSCETNEGLAPIQPEKCPFRITL